MWTYRDRKEVEDSKVKMKKEGSGVGGLVTTGEFGRYSPPWWRCAEGQDHVGAVGEEALAGRWPSSTSRLRTTGRITGCSSAAL